MAIMPIQQTHFQIVKATFVPDWETMGPRRIGGLGWRKIRSIENPMELIGEWMRMKLGRPSKPVICSMMDASGEWAPTTEAERLATPVLITRYFHLHAHDGHSRSWNPCMFAQIEVSLVLHPQWEACDRCGEIRHVLDVDPCACNIEALAHAVAERIPHSGAANDRGPL